MRPGSFAQFFVDVFDLPAEHIRSFATSTAAAEQLRRAPRCSWTLGASGRLRVAFLKLLGGSWALWGPFWGRLLGRSGRLLGHYIKRPVFYVLFGPPGPLLAALGRPWRPLGRPWVTLAVLGWPGRLLDRPEPSETAEPRGTHFTASQKVV